METKVPEIGFLYNRSNKGVNSPDKLFLEYLEIHLRLEQNLGNGYQTTET
jgi:hypothetical protein